jgi:hypothetical protein
MASVCIDSPHELHHDPSVSLPGRTFFNLILRKNMMRKLHPTLTAALVSALLTTTAAHAEPARFDAATGMMTIPQLDIAGNIFYTVRFQLGTDNKLSLVDFATADPNAQSGTCTLDNINFNRYIALPSFGTVVTKQQLDEIIGCVSVLSSTGNESNSLQWHLNTSTASCPQYIYAALVPAADNQQQIMDYGIIGINSDNNQPKPCPTTD